MFEAYEVAVKLKLVDHFSSVMGMVTNRLSFANGQAEKLQKNLDGVGKLFRAGMLTTGAGFGIAMALKAATSEAVKYEQAMNRLKALNLDNRIGAGTTKGLEQKALEIANLTRGTSNTEAVKLITETQAITGNVSHTLEIAPVLAQLKFGMETYMSEGGKGEGHGSAAEKQFQDIVKVMEMRGLMRDFTGEKLDRMADLFTKNYVASGGMVKSADFLNMLKTGGIAGKSVNDDFMFALGHIMQEKGGNRSGTQLMSAYQNLIAGRTTQQVAEQLQKYGMLKPGSIEYGSTGHIKKVKPEALKAAEVMEANPLDYMNQYILQALKAKGVDTENQKKVIPLLNQFASNRTGADFLAQLYLERNQIANYVEQSKNAMGYKALYKQGEKSTTGQQEDLKAQVTKLEQVFGDAALPLLKSALEQAIPLVKQLGEWLGKNPEGLKMLVTSIAGLSVAMMVSGPLMMLGSGLRLLSIGIGLVNGPLASLSVAMAFRGIGGAAGIASIAGNLGSVAGQLKLLGGAAALFMSYELGKAAGTYIYNHSSAETQDKIGGTVATALAWFGNKEAQDSLNANLGRKTSANDASNAAFNADQRKHVTAPGANGKYATPPPAKASARSQC